MRFLKSFIARNRFTSEFFEIIYSVKLAKRKYRDFADYKTLEKGSSYLERFREIVSDPLNLIIERVPHAGYLDGQGNVFLHNGVRVPIKGSGSYYQDFSEIFVINRGVHEPLEEYCFQELLRCLSSCESTHSMLELGAYWGHYSLWFSKLFPSAQCTLVEPELLNLEAGKANFIRNGVDARFIQDVVGINGFSVDKFLCSGVSTDNSLTLLHSDIQGYEVEMLVGAEKSLRAGAVMYIMVSTHGDRLHNECERLISDYGYVIEVSSEPLYHTTSTDGFIFARRSDLAPVILASKVLGRVEIMKSNPQELRKYLSLVGR